MTDRELLEFAAKAAGIDFNTRSGSELRVAHGDVFRAWNPLDSDGDALRLAVKLNMFVDICDDCVGTSVSPAIWEKVEILDNEYRPDNTKESVTRRAIVRAAAEIGKAMK